MLKATADRTRLIADELLAQLYHPILMALLLLLIQQLHHRKHLAVLLIVLRCLAAIRL